MNDINALIEGFAEFKKRLDQDPSTFQNLVHLGQKPSTLMIACVDSRVDPAIITNANPGDILTVRNVANLVPTFEMAEKGNSVKAALEFGVCHLKVHHIIVMGHSRCGGIRSLVTRLSSPTHATAPSALNEWTAIADNVGKNTLEALPNASIEEQVCHCSRQSVSQSLKNLETYPWIKEAIDQGELDLKGWYFNLAESDLQELDRETGNYHTLC